MLPIFLGHSTNIYSSCQSNLSGEPIKFSITPSITNKQAQSEEQLLWNKYFSKLDNQFASSTQPIYNDQFQWS